MHLGDIELENSEDVEPLAIPLVIVVAMLLFILSILLLVIDLAVGDICFIVNRDDDMGRGGKRNKSFVFCSFIIFSFMDEQDENI